MVLPRCLFGGPLVRVNGAENSAPTGRDAADGWFFPTFCLVGSKSANYDMSQRQCHVIDVHFFI
eukprot:scaffold945_cov170-Amphora_coffeaeformis.AAC.6